MRVIVQNKLGTFPSMDRPYDEEEYNRIVALLSRIHELVYFSFDTQSGGKMFMDQKLIHESVFFAER